jgi:hypothetical protein
MSNSTSDLLTPIKQELSTIDYQWMALESFSDLLCVLMAVYVVTSGVRKLWPYHEGYGGTKKGFIWLAATWGVKDHPHLFRTLTGLIELTVFAGCLMCFLPGPMWQLVTCLSLVLGIALCVSFLITHKSDPWKQLLGILRNMLQAAVALGIRLYQDFDWANTRLVKPFYIGTSCIVLGVLYMIYRRARYGRIPDPLLG